MMPGMNREPKSITTNIYDEYAAVATVPLTIDWGHKNKNKNKNKAGGGIKYDDKQLPLPPIITDPLSFPNKVVGRRGFGVTPSSMRMSSASPLSRKWSSSDDSDTGSRLVRRSAMRRQPRDSTDSVESIWFGFDDVRSTSTTTSSPQKNFNRSRDSSDYDESSDSILHEISHEIDTWSSSSTSQSRIRILNYENISSGAPTEIYVGELYEIVSSIWETISSHPQNINSFKSLFSESSLPYSNVINLVSSNSISLETFFKSTELQIHINVPQNQKPPRYTSLDTLEITIPTDIVHAFTTTSATNRNQIKGILKIRMIQQIGEYIYNHILLQDDNMELKISPSIDLKRFKEMKGSEITGMGIFGGILTYRWRFGKVQVLFKKGTIVYRVPERIIGEMYRSDLIQAFRVEELDL